MVGKVTSVQLSFIVVELFEAGIGLFLIVTFRRFNLARS